MTLVILTEEPSMETTLRSVLPRLGLLPGDFQIVVFQGVGDLEASLIRRVRAWTDPKARFLVIRDNDNGDCVARKARLTDRLAQAGGLRPAKVRIVIQELEAWFLGDLDALRQAGFLKGLSTPAELRGDPEAHLRPVDILRKLDRTYQKGIGARRIAPYLDLNRNRAASFHATIRAIQDLAALNGA